jgi:hypothetical protein
MKKMKIIKNETWTISKIFLNNKNIPCIYQKNACCFDYDDVKKTIAFGTDNNWVNTLKFWSL